MEQVAEDTYPTTLESTIRFDPNNILPECVLFSPDGRFLVSGTEEGFVEVWECIAGNWNRAEFQFNEAGETGFIAGIEPVLCADISRDSILVASGSQNGLIKVWRMNSGQCIRRYDLAHSEAITSISFSPDGRLLLSSSVDGTARIHGMESGKTLREFRGHASYVNDAIFTDDGSRVITASSDCTVKVWDAKTTVCLQTFTPPPPSRGGDAAVNSVRLLNDEQIVVCNRTSSVYIMTMEGQIVKSFSSGVEEGGDFVAATVSPNGQWIYCVGEDMNLYCFSYGSGNLEHVMKVHEMDVLGVAHHPNMNLVATYSQDCTVKLWRP